MEAYKYNGEVYYTLNDIIEESSSAFLEDALDSILNDTDYLMLTGKNLEIFYELNWVKKSIQQKKLVIVKQKAKDVLMSIPKLKQLSNNIAKLRLLISFADEEW